MKDHVEIGYLTKYDAFRVNRDLEIRVKIRTNVSNFEITPNYINSYKFLSVL